MASIGNVRSMSSGRTRSVTATRAASAATTGLAARSVGSENCPPPLRVPPTGSKKTKSTSTSAKPSLNAAPRRPGRTNAATTGGATQQTLGLGSPAARRKSAPAALTPLSGSSLSNQQQNKVSGGRSSSFSARDPISMMKHDDEGPGRKGPSKIAEEFDLEGNKENIPPFRLVSLGSRSPVASGKKNSPRFYSSMYPIRAGVPSSKEKFGLGLGPSVHIIQLPRGEDRVRHEEKKETLKNILGEEEKEEPQEGSVLKAAQLRCSHESEDSDSDSASEGADVVEVSDSSEESESDDASD